MKKILSILVLMVLVVGLVAPLAVNGQGSKSERLRECCTIRRGFEIEKSSISIGVAKSGIDAVPCVKNASGVLPDPCKLTKGNSIGPSGIKTTDVQTACPKPLDENATVSNVSAAWGMICLLNTVYYVTDWIFYLMMIAVVIVFVIAGARFMMTSGDPEKTKNAKNMMILGVIGLIIALVAKLVPSVVRMIIGMS